MKIVVVGSSRFDSLEFHVQDAFTQLGHEAILVDPAEGVPVSAAVQYWLSRFVEPYDRYWVRRVAARIAALKPSLVVVVYRHLHPELVQLLRQKLPDCPLVQLNPDTVATLERQQIIASGFDYYFSKEPYLVETLRDKARLNAQYLPEGFNPRVHVRPPMPKAEAESMTDVDVLMYGNLYPYRAQMAGQLLRANIRVRIYGRPGPFIPASVRQAFTGQYLDGETKNRLLYGARIVFNNFYFAEITSANQKYFEINGTGGFQLCDYKPLLEEYTGVPCDRVTFRTIDDAIDKIRYYLAHPTERHELADQQYAHFQQYHTFDQRMARLLTTIGHASVCV